MFSSSAKLRRAGTSCQLSRVRVILRPVFRPASLAFLNPWRARSNAPGTPRNWSWLAGRAESRLTPTYRILASAKSLATSGVIRVPLVDMTVLKPASRAWKAIEKKLRLISGSPPVRMRIGIFIWARSSVRRIPSSRLISSSSFGMASI